MITGEQIASLPDDPDQAFFSFVDIVTKKYEADMDNTTRAEEAYVVALTEFMDEFEVELTPSFPQAAERLRDFMLYFNKFKLAVDTLVLRRRLRDKRQRLSQPSYIQLDAEKKKALHLHIQKMRDLVDQIDLPLDKRDAILSKLNAISAEIDSSRTTIQKVLDLAIQVAVTAEEVGKRINPLQKALDGFLSKIGQSWGDFKGLPSPGPRKQIEGPKGRPADELAGLDADIPS